MQDVQAEVDRRFTEIGLFIKFLRELDRAPSSSLPTAKASALVFKACTFLLLYNVVESCVRSAFGNTYDEIAGDSLAYDGVTEKIQSLWLRQQLNVPTDSANHQTYIDLAAKVAQSASQGDVIRLESRKLPVSGNLDSEAVRLVCAKHGIRLKVSKWAKGGVELTTVKDQRNALAHGHKSFSECGRDFAVRDLERIAKQTRHFLNGFMKSVSEYNQRHRYRK